MVVGISKTYGGVAMWQIEGIAKNIDKPIIAPFSCKSGFVNCFLRKNITLLSHKSEKYKFASISSLKQVDTNFPIIYDAPFDKLSKLKEGDVLRLCPDGMIQRVFEIQSEQNVLFLTERCNSRCIMCPQPQMPYDYSDDVIKILQCIPNKALHHICLSGGEPTLSAKIFDILKRLKKYPFIQPIILTNGRKFSDKNFVNQFIKNAPFNMIYAIPLYSSIPLVHDKIVGIEGAFKETITGIYNLTRFRVPIEIRIVLMKQNIFNLAELAEYIGWNLPMTIHVAFMGMEVYGRASENAEDVWIEPITYMNNLIDAVKILDYRNIPVSVYNLPLCLLPNELKKYNKVSISAWKQGYIEKCQDCLMRDRCNGFFTTSQRIPIGIHKF